jgi:tRNA dimethylallyltransferase
MTSKIPILIIAGPTGSGKSTLALKLAQEHNAEIVNLDAFQIYRGMRIGTAQPSQEAQATVPHWLYGFQDPNVGMSAAGYAELADSVIQEIAQRGRRALLVGGTGFYMRALLYGLFEAPPIDEGLRKELAERAATPQGKEVLFQELSSVDPEAAARISKNDIYRINRALEVFYQSGKPLSMHHKEHQRPERYEHKILALEVEKALLQKRQQARVREMFEAGWEAEVQALLASGVTVNSPGFRAIGYHSVAELVGGRMSREEVFAKISKQHHQYAKRQRTWLRAEKQVEYVSFQVDTSHLNSLLKWSSSR